MQPHEAPAHVKEELLDNENIVWIGKPNPKFALLVATPIIIIAGFFLTGIVKELLDSLHRNLPLPFTLFNCIGLLFVAFFLSTPVKLWLQAVSTYYVVTDRRYLVISGNNNRKVEQYQKSSLTPMMSMTFMGLTNLCWSAPGTHTDSDGDTRPNVVWFNGLDPREVHKITSEPFPKLSEMSRNLPK